MTVSQPRLKSCIAKNSFNRLDTLFSLLLLVVAVFCFIKIWWYLIGFGLIGDDPEFAKEDLSLQFLINRYQQWSSRLVIESILVFSTHHLVLYKAVLSLLFFSVPVAIYLALTKILPNQSAVNNTLNKAVLSLAVSSLLPYFQLPPVGIIAGMTNYYFPIVFLIWSYSLLVSFKDFSYLKALCLLALSLLAFSHEQCCLLAFLTLGPIYLLKKSNLKLFLVFAVLCVLSVIFHATCPGNMVRTVDATAICLPEFVNYSLFDKLSLGTILFIERTITSTKIMFLFLAGSLFLMLLGRVDNYKTYIAKILFLICFVAVYVLLRKALPDVEVSTKQEVFDTVTATFVVYSVIIALMLVALLYLQDVSIIGKVILLWTFLAACAVTVLIGWSPTMFASGLRTEFMGVSTLCLLALGVGTTTNQKTVLSVFKVMLVVFLILNLRKY